MNDTTNALQAAANSTGGAVCLPYAFQPYVLDGPIFVDGDGTEIRGVRGTPKLMAAPGYSGPLLVFGMAQPGINWDYYRPLAPPGGDIYDASVLAGLRGLDTQGNSCLLIQAHPMQYGGFSVIYGGNQPAYWSTVTKFTQEFLLSRPNGVTWTPGANLWGMRDTSQRVKPWAWTVGETPDVLRFIYTTSDLVAPGQLVAGTRKIDVPIPGPGPWRVTLQLDLDEGNIHLWVNGVRTSPVIRDSSGCSMFGPGLKFAAHDGSVPLLIGTCGFQAHSETRLQLFGLRMTDGLVYRNQATEAFVEGVYQDWPVNDRTRYFSMLDNGSLRQIGLLPLSDPPSRTVDLMGYGRGLGFWVVDGAIKATKGNSASRLVLEGPGQALISLGAVLDFEATRVRAESALQGIGSLSVSANYPISLDHCVLNGSDAGYFGVWQILWANKLRLSGCGRDGVRLQGGNATFLGGVVDFIGSATETVFQSLGDEYGGQIRIQDWVVDTEGAAVKRAYVEAVAGNSPSQQLTIDGLGIGTATNAALVRLVGTPGIPDANAAKYDVRRIACYGKDYRAALEVVGGGWSGSFDDSQLAGPNA